MAIISLHEESEDLSSQTIPSSACSGTSNLENPVQKAEPLEALALRTRGGMAIT